MPIPETLDRLVEAQVERSPDAVAVVSEGHCLTYQELDARANQVAHWLRERGVGPDVLVGVCMERGLELVVAVHGVLKAGGAYVPVDPTHPVRRVRGLLDAAGVAATLTQRRFLPVLDSALAPALCLDAEWAAPASLPGARPAGGAEPDNLVYVIHTSGSTGQPKGVMNVHAALVNRLRWMQRAYCLTGADAVLHKTPTTFDVSVWELCWPLLTGARMVLARPDGHRDTAYLAGLIAEQGVTTAHFVPAMLSVFLEEPGLRAACATLRRVICSGEALPVELQSRCFAALDAELHNLYGPTEAAIDVTAWACRREPGQRTVPIGRPIDNVRIDLLAPDGSPAARGETGELHIGGAGLARGYLGRADLTAERFVPDALAGVPGARAYRTGDLGRLLPGGSIEFLGRIDHQVKIRGFRIELEEVQLAIEQHPDVRECVVLARDGALVACVIPSAGQAPAPGRLRAFVRERLPDYMVPAGFVTLEAFPLTSSGKVDRRALAAVAEAGPAPEPMASELERTIAAIWREVLGVERVSRHDRFPELGGTELQAVEVQRRLSGALARPVSLADVLEHPSVSLLAAHVEALAEGAGPPRPDSSPLAAGRQADALRRLLGARKRSHADGR